MLSKTIYGDLATCVGRHLKWTVFERVETVVLNESYHHRSMIIAKSFRNNSSRFSKR